MLYICPILTWFSDYLKGMQVPSRKTAQIIWVGIYCINICFTGMRFNNATSTIATSPDVWTAIVAQVASNSCESSKQTSKLMRKRCPFNGAPLPLVYVAEFFIPGHPIELVLSTYVQLQDLLIFMDFFCAHITLIKLRHERQHGKVHCMRSCILSGGWSPVTTSPSYDVVPQDSYIGLMTWYNII